MPIPRSPIARLGRPDDERERDVDDVTGFADRARDDQEDDHGSPPVRRLRCGAPAEAAQVTDSASSIRRAPSRRSDVDGGAAPGVCRAASSGPEPGEDDQDLHRGRSDAQHLPAGDEQERNPRRDGTGDFTETTSRKVAAIATARPIGTRPDAIKRPPANASSTTSPAIRTGGIWGRDLLASTSCCPCSGVWSEPIELLVDAAGYVLPLMVFLYVSKASAPCARRDSDRPGSARPPPTEPMRQRERRVVRSPRV